MLLISVVVIAVLGAAFAFAPQFRAGVSDVGENVSELLREGATDETVGKPALRQQ